MEFKTFNKIHYDRESFILLHMLQIKRLPVYTPVKTLYM